MVIYFQHICRFESLESKIYKRNLITVNQKEILEEHEFIYVPMRI